MWNVVCIGGTYFESNAIPNLISQKVFSYITFSSIKSWNMPGKEKANQNYFVWNWISCKNNILKV